jgi:gliding motility-associated-like protein
LQFPTGSNEIIFVNTENGCSDTLIVNVNCDEIEEIEIFTTVWLHDTDTLCLAGLPINGNIISIENLCPELSDDNVHFTFDEINGCVIYEGLAIGIDSACLIVCTDLEECISILFITEVIEPADPELLPIAVVDISTTLQNNPVEVEVLENDTINGTLVSLSIIQQPLNGTATVALDNSGIEYVPDPNYCDNDQPDEFIYLLCNENGCDTAVVFITVDCDGIQIFTGFSPNKDGVNDNFIITGLDEYPENILRVYNRWGNMVYYKENYRNQWQGTWEGKDVPDGTYFYILDTGRGQIYSGYLQIHR